MTEFSTVLPPNQRLLVTMVLMAGTLMVVLDSTIANVALPHMQASLSATPESVSWVLTSYILATAIAMPLTGFLSDRLGRRTLFTGAIVGFTISSGICGVAATLPLMVAARVLQGLCGACLMPMSQAIMYDINPPDKHVRAMTIWAMVVVVGPIAGPVLGGWLTENFDWRWVFFINVPIGIGAAFGSRILLTNGTKTKRNFDLMGFVLLAVSLSGMQLMLDRGVSLDWFDAPEIWIELGVAVSAFWMFAVHTATGRETIVPPALLADRNFVSALIALTVLGGILVAGAALVPPMMQRLLGYPVLLAGLLTAPRGVGTMIAMLIVGRVSKIIDPRLTILTGVLLLVLSLWMMTGFELGMDRDLLIWSGFIQGIGMGLAFLPLNLMALATLHPSIRTEAASLFSLTRSIGGSVAISVMTTLIASNTQVSHADLGAHVTTTSAPYLTVGLLERLGYQGTDAMQLVDAEINRQAVMIAYLDDYWVMMWAAILIIPLIAMLKGGEPGEDMPMPDAH